MSNSDKLVVRPQLPPVESGRRTNPLAHVFDDLVRFCRSRSLFMLHYCTGCGAIELPPAMTSRFDMERLGIQPMVSPRQADILLITGYVSLKTLKRIILTYEQMPAPKYVIGICSCTVNGGMYWQSYATAKVLKEYLPVDVYIAGCMPRPEAVISGLRVLMEDIRTGRADSWQRYFRETVWRGLADAHRYRRRGAPLRPAHGAHPGQAHGVAGTASEAAGSTADAAGTGGRRETLAFPVGKVKCKK
jgi:NADH-quinone oxidoreductase subunit B